MSKKKHLKHSKLQQPSSKVDTIKVSSLPETKLNRVSHSRRRDTHNRNRRVSTLKSVSDRTTAATTTVNDTVTDVVHLKVEIVGDDETLAKYCRSVHRSRNKPLGRYEQWTDDRITHQRDVVVVVAHVEQPTSTDAAHRAFIEKFSQQQHFVVDMLSKHSGRLYRAIPLSTPQQALTDAECVAQIVNLKFSIKNNCFALSVTPYVQQPPSTTSKLQPHQDTTPLIGTRLTVFFDDDTQLSGKVHYTDDLHVELWTEDSLHQKAWLRLPANLFQKKPTSQHEKKGHLTHYHLRRQPLQSESNTFVWILSVLEEKKRVQRTQYVARCSKATYKAQLQRLLAQYAPHNISHLNPLTVVSLSESENKEQQLLALHTDTNSERLDDTPISVRTIPKDDDDVQLQTDYDIQKKNTSHTICDDVHTFPFSVIQQLQKVSESAAKNNTKKAQCKMVWVSLQPYTGTYISFLELNESQSLRTQHLSRQYTLLPTTQQLYYTNSLSTSVAPKQDDYIAMTLSSPNAKHLADCLKYCEESQQRCYRHSKQHPHLQCEIRYVEPVSDVFYQKPTSSVRIRVRLVDVPELTRRLTGQVFVQRETTNMNYSIPIANDNSTHHLGQMCKLFHYHNVDDSPTLTLIDHMKVLLLVNNEQHLFPLPLRHTIQTKGSNTRMLLNKDIYHPNQLLTHNEHTNTHETVLHSLPQVDRNANILHDKLAKKLTSARVLFDMEQSFDPSWFNVLENNHVYRPITTLRHHFGLKSSSSSTYTHLLRSTAIVNCDADACTHAICFTKTPTYDKKCVTPYYPPQEKPHSSENDSSENNHSRLSIASTTHHPTSFPDEFYGYSEKLDASTSQLTHLLYGTLAHFHNNVDTSFQKKHTQCHRMIEGYGAYSLQVHGVIATPLFNASAVVFTHLHHLECVFRQDDREIKMSPLLQQHDFASIRFPLSISSYCRILNRLLLFSNSDTKHNQNKHTSADISVDFCKHRQLVCLHSKRCFEIIAPAGLFMLGAHTGMKATWNAQTKTHVILLSHLHRLTRSELSPHSLHMPQFKVCFKYIFSNNNTQHTKTDDNFDETEAIDGHDEMTIKIGPFVSPKAFAVRNCTKNMAPVESPSKYPLQTLVGRDGHTAYTSTSIHHTILHTEYIPETNTHYLFVPSGVCCQRVEKTKPHTTHTPTKTNLVNYRELQDHLCCVSCWRVYSASVVSFVLVEKRAKAIVEPQAMHFYSATAKSHSVEWSSSTLPHWIHLTMAKMDVTNLENAFVEVSASQHYVYHARVQRHPRRGDWILVVSLRVSEKDIVDILRVFLPVQIEPIIVHMGMHFEPRVLVCNVLDTSGELHTYSWKQPPTMHLQKSQWQADVDSKAHSTLRLTNANTSLNNVVSMHVNDDRVMLGHSNGVVDTFERVSIKSMHMQPAHQWNVSVHLTHCPLIWRWMRCAKQIVRSVVVECFHSEPVEHLTQHQCEESHLASRVRMVLCKWFGSKPLETLSVAYFMREHSLHSTIPFCRYLLNSMTGANPKQSLATLQLALQQDVMQNERRAVRTNARQEALRYIGGRPIFNSLSYQESTHFNEMLRSIHTLVDQRVWRLSDTDSLYANHHNVPRSQRITKKKTVRKTTATSNSKPNEKSSSHHTSAHTTIHSKRDLFYFKMSKLLGSTVGVSYVRNMYAQSDVFRHQFHQCRGYCYYKLLFKLKSLSVHGNRSSRRHWTDSIRDKFTTVMEGDTYHICHRCGDTVCKQAEGLRVEFGAFGQSSTHQDTADRDDVMQKIDYKPITINTQQQQQYLSTIYLYIDKQNLSAYQHFIFDLPIVSVVQKYIRTDATVFYHLCTNTNVPTNKILKLLELACEAVQNKIQTLQSINGSSRKIEFQRKPWETQIIQEWVNTLQLQMIDIQRGIPARKDFRPQLFVQPSTQTHDNWKQLHRELNDRSNVWNSAFDWTSRQNVSSLYEYNDVYACVNRSVVDTDAYTTLPQLTHCTLRTVEALQQTDEPHGTPMQRHRFGRCAHSDDRSHCTMGQSFPLQKHEKLHHRNDYNHNHNHKSSITMPSLLHNRCLPDTKRRCVSNQGLCGATQYEQKMFPYNIQTLFDNNLVSESATVDHILCLLGLTAKQRIRMSTNPSFMQNLEWVKYYQQLDTSQPNESTTRVLNQIKRKIAPHLLRDVMRYEYDKFIL